MSVKDYERQPKGIKQVKERGHILFTPITLSDRDFRIYIAKEEKLG